MPRASCAEAPHADVAGTGIEVTRFERGATKSDHREHDPGSGERVPKVGSAVPVRTIVRGVRRDRKHVVVPFVMKPT